MSKLAHACIALLTALAATSLHAQTPESVEYRGSLIVNASSGALAPYMIGSWNYGKVTGGDGVWLDGLIHKDMNLGKRFSWGAGFEALAGYGSAADYELYSHGTWTARSNRQAPVRLQQLYAEIKYRGVYLTAGMKERHSEIVDDRLSSGDLTRSNNAIPIPGASVGFVDFQNIPFTKSWLQIGGEFMYGRFMDRRYKEHTFNYYNGVISLDNWYVYRRCYFRTKPSAPFSATFGMQAAGQFAGNSWRYAAGTLQSTNRRGFRFKDLLKMLLPIEGTGEGYYAGNTLGSWDLRARYRFANNSQLALYFEWPWEDGSGIGKQNAWDGLWGLQYTFAKEGPLTSAVVEYFDFTDQSGPLHWAPNDFPGTSLTDQATGGDDYYNNEFYSTWTNYGMSLGTPFVLSPLYNLNGVPEYMHTRARGFHAAALGKIASTWDWCAKVSWQQAAGSGRKPGRKLHDTSAMVEATWRPAGTLRGFAVNGKVAFDAGTLRGNNVGAMLTISYSGSFSLAKK